MSRVLVGMTTLAMLVNVPGVLAADAATVPRVQIVKGADAMTVSRHAETVLASQRVTPHGFDLALARSDRHLRLTGDVDGRVSVTSGRASRDCWGWYERDVARAWFDLEACLEEARSSLNPFKTMWCSYQFNVRASVAFVMLVGCSG